MPGTARDSVFISYSHADEEWLNRVNEALAPDVRNGRIDAWHDRRLEAGTQWEPEIRNAIDRARVALFLVTPRFLASSFIMEKELPLILAAAGDGLTMLWLPIEGTFYGPGATPALQPITRFQAVGSPTRPLAGQSPEAQRAALLDLCRRIDRLLGRIRVPRNLPFTSLGTLFKGREGAIDDLERHLTRHGSAAIFQPEAITGMGGIGKTRLAVEYAWRHQDDFDALLFVSAGTPEDLATNFARLCGPDVLDLAEYRLGKQPEQYEAVLQWLQKNAGWLLIFDNVDTVAAVAAVQALVPKLGGGQVVITSRIARWEGSVRALGLDLLSEEAAVDYLLERTTAGRQPQPDEKANAQGLAQELGRLALALEQAAAYVNATHLPLEEYRQRWKSARDRLLKYHDPLATHYPNSLAATWLTSFEQLTENGQRLLGILAWLAAEPIPRVLLEAGGGPFAAEKEGEFSDKSWPAFARWVLRILVRTKRKPWTAGKENGQPDERRQRLVLDAQDALADLSTYSLISWSPEKTTLSVHGLVQEVTRRNQADDEQLLRISTALRWVNSGFEGDPDDVRSWVALEPVAPHARVTVEEADRRNIPKPTIRLMNQLGIFYAARAEWRQAEPLSRRVLYLCEKSLRPDHPFVASGLNNLALLLQATNRLTEAEPLMVRALAISEKRYGLEHPEVAGDLNNLAQLLRDTNRLAEAEPLMRRALAIREKSYGPEHPDLATYLNNLAGLLKATNRLAEAEPLMVRALAISEKGYGPEHPEVAVRLNNLAQLLRDTDRLTEAEPLMRRALAIDEKSYGPEYPDLATYLNNLAELLQATNRLAEAEPLMRRALAISEKSHGPEHPKVAVDLNNLAQLLQATNRLAEAEPMIVRALAIWEKSFGQDHPNVASALNNLALLLQATNRRAEAEPLMRRALVIDEKSYGPEHPDVAGRLNNLAQLLQATNRPAEAEPMIRRALAIDEKSYGPKAPMVARDLNNLARLLQATNRLAEADPMMRRGLEILLNFTRASGHRHPHLEEVVDNYGNLLLETGLSEDQVRARLREIAPELFP